MRLICPVKRALPSLEATTAANGTPVGELGVLVLLLAEIAPAVAASTVRFIDAYSNALDNVRGAQVNK
jgi:hypothetical protein